LNLGGKMSKDFIIPTVLVPLQNRRKGILLFVAGISLLTTLDMVVKVASFELSTPQIVWGRYVAQSIAILSVTGRLSVLACLRTRAPSLHLLRALFLFVANAALMLALRYLPLTEASVIGFASPLLLTALTYPVLGESVGPARWAAVVIGFIGVLVVMQPGSALFHWAALLPLLMAICAAFYHVLTPIVARVEDPAISIYFLGVGGAIVMTAIVPWFWTQPDAWGWAMLLIIGVLGAFGHLLIVRAFVQAPVSLLAPLFYLQLIGAVVYGWFIFGDMPGLATLLGGALIILSGIYVYRTK
jgi:drug/metabolite transporter (DMT)-like permease